MKKITKMVAALAMVIAGLLAGGREAKADVTGAADAALLLQQILQYVQDFDIGNLTDENLQALVRSVDDRARGMKRIIDLCDAGQKGFGTFNNVIEATRMVARTTSDVQYYIDFISRIGDDYDITQCYYLYRTFTNRSKLVLSDMKSTLATLSKIESSEPMAYMEAIDKVLSKAIASIDYISNDCISSMKGIVRDKMNDEEAKASHELSNLVII